MSYASSRSPADRYINAAKDGLLDILQDAPRRDLNHPDEDGMTATMWAAHNGHLDALRLIVGRGGDVDLCDYLGLTPLHHAAVKGHLHVITYLVNWGCNIFALDNDHHSALDLAHLYSKPDIVQFVDAQVAEQHARKPRNVQKQREKALVKAEENIKRYEKLKHQAAKQAEKQQKKIASQTVRGQRSLSTGEQPDIKSERKSLFKSVTMALRGGNKSQRGNEMQTHTSAKTYSEFAGMTAKGGVAKKIQRKSQDMNGTGAGPEFKISDVDESGKRTLRSLNSAHGVISGKSSDVMYLPGQRGGDGGEGGAAGDTMASSSSRPTAIDVFSRQQPHHHFNRSNLFKSRSEPDLLDSGNASYFGDEDDDEENSAGLFNRPGFGKTAFLPNASFANTLHSFDNGQVDMDGHQIANGDDSILNGDIGRSGNDDDALVDSEPGTWRGVVAKDLPWDQDEVDPLDDDDDQTVSSPIEMLLWSEGLETYLHKFLQEKVDLDMLMKTKNLDGDLKEIGLPFGPRKKLQEAIQRRKDILGTPKYMCDSFL